jgi:hypothetical protein
MTNILGVVVLTLLISACSGHKTKNSDIDFDLFDDVKLERVVTLYKCSNFFDIVTEARKHRTDPQEHIDTTKKLASSAIEIANKILHEQAEGQNLDLNDIISLYERIGLIKAKNMVREIGSSSKLGESNKTDALFLSCYQVIQKEEFLVSLSRVSNLLESKNTSQASSADPIEN